MIEPQAGRLFTGPVGTAADELTEISFGDARALDRALGGGTVVSHGPKRELRQRIAFRHPAAGLDSGRLIGARIDTLTLHGVNLAGPGLVVTSAEPVDDGDNLWIVAERWEDA